MPIVIIDITVRGLSRNGFSYTKWAVTVRGLSRNGFSYAKWAVWKTISRKFSSYNTLLNVTVIK
jgi:hypothetical protein